MDCEKRKGDISIPSNLEETLNKAQRQALPGIKFLGWEPRNTVSPNVRYADRPRRKVTAQRLALARPSFAPHLGIAYVPPFTVESLIFMPFDAARLKTFPAAIIPH